MDLPLIDRALPLSSGLLILRLTRIHRQRPNQPIPGDIHLLYFPHGHTNFVAHFSIHAGKGHVMDLNPKREWVKSICVGGVLSSTFFKTSTLWWKSHGHPSSIWRLSPSFENSVSHKFSSSSLKVMLSDVRHNRNIKVRNSSFWIRRSNMMLPMRHMPLFIRRSAVSSSVIVIPIFSPTIMVMFPYKDFRISSIQSHIRNIQTRETEKDNKRTLTPSRTSRQETPHSPQKVTLERRPRGRTCLWPLWIGRDWRTVNIRLFPT